jgi:DNA topoisomerase-1
VASPTEPQDAAAEAAAHAREARLRYVSPEDPGIRRQKNGKGWSYVGPDGKRIEDDAALARIRKLAIPPAYREVWICADARGHLQATGLDARGRKQYRYHPDWRVQRDSAKFERMVQFGEALPKLRRAIRRDLALPGLPQEKVLAVVVALLDSTLVRVGNVEYARDNNSFGLTTLRNRHVKFPSGRARFSFRGKSGKDHVVDLEDPALARLLRRCQQLPGQRLFQYLDADGTPRPIDSGDVNDYLREACGADFTAKDFRTWGGTLAAIKALVRAPLPRGASERTIAAIQNAAIREVAEQLGNTPAVCRASYIHPAVFKGWRNRTLARAIPDAALGHSRKLERMALDFLAARSG